MEKTQGSMALLVSQKLTQQEANVVSVQLPSSKIHHVPLIEVTNLIPNCKGSDKCGFRLFKISNIKKSMKKEFGMPTRDGQEENH